MVDPFTLAAGIAGLLKLTIELTKIINEYTGSVKNAPKEAQELFKGLSALGHVLEQLNRFLCSENAKPNSFDHTCVLCFATNTCQDKLQSALRNFMKMSEVNGPRTSNASSGRLTSKKTYIQSIPYTDAHKPFSFP
jgi:hypothetical protein